MNGATVAAPSAGELDAAILERAKSLCNQALFTIALQRRRLRSVEPEDDIFIFRRWADFEFLIVALRRLRRAAGLAARPSHLRAAIESAIAEFDATLPGLVTMRDVGEHIDDYALKTSKRRHRDVIPGQLQVGSLDETVFAWLGHQLDTDIALAAAEKLFSAVKLAAEQQFRLLAATRKPDISSVGPME
jgi:hypothetical protein